MTVLARQIVVARRSVGDQVAAKFKLLEDSAHDMAIEAGQCMSMVLEAHRGAGLPPHVGMEIVTLLGEVSAAAAQNCARMGDAHKRLHEISVTYNIPFAGVPACPENEAARNY